MLGIFFYVIIKKGKTQGTDQNLIPCENKDIPKRNVSITKPTTINNYSTSLLNFKVNLNEINQFNDKKKLQPSLLYTSQTVNAPNSPNGPKNHNNNIQDSLYDFSDTEEFVDSITNRASPTNIKSFHSIN